jgi:spore coat protein SA
MKSKLLQILPQEEYFSYSNGGAISTWVKECFIDLKGFNTTVSTPCAKDYIKGFSLIKVPFGLFRKIGIILGGSLGHHFKYNLYIIYVAIFSYLFRYRLIHVHNRPTYIPILKKINPKAKVILHMHNDHILKLNKKQFVALSDAVDLIISVSNYIQKGIISKGKEFGIHVDSKCKVLLNGANANHFVKIDQITSKNNLLFVGRLNKNKGIKQLIEATLIAKQKIPDIKLKIAGSAGFGNLEDTPFVKEIKELASQSPESFDFLGYIKHSQVPELFKDSALYVIPSIWNDPCPLAVIEGMATGVPMIVGNQGGIPELVSDSALLIDCNRTKLLADAIVQILTDKKKAHALSTRAYNRFINQLTWQHVRKNFKLMINENGFPI